MNKYIPILILDNDDTPTSEAMSLTEFIAIIDQHVKNCNANPDEVYVTLNAQIFEDEDFFEEAFAEIQFSVRKK